MDRVKNYILLLDFMVKTIVAILLIFSLLQLIGFILELVFNNYSIAHFLKNNNLYTDIDIFIRPKPLNLFSSWFTYPLAYLISYYFVPRKSRLGIHSFIFFIQWYVILLGVILPTLIWLVITTFELIGYYFFDIS